MAWNIEPQIFEAIGMDFKKKIKKFAINAMQGSAPSFWVL